MRKRNTRVLLFVLIFLLCATPVEAALAEQTQAVLPTIDVYLYDNNDEGLADVRLEDITASMDGALLRVEDYGTAEELSKGTCYYMLLDISLSITNYDFSAMKKLVLSAHSRLGEGDQLVLITFGDDVTTVLKGGESYEEAESTLKNLRPSDMTTALYAAMQRALELAPSRALEGLRNVVIVLTDGADFSDSGITLNELQSREWYNELSLFAVCTRNGTRAERESMGAMARSLGGDMYLLDSADPVKQMDAILERLSDSMLLRLRTEGNRADGGTHDLSLVLGKLSVTTKVTTRVWAADTEAPTLLEAVDLGSGGAIRLRFSEAVEQIDTLSSYELTDKDGMRVNIASASYSEGGKQSVDVYPAATPYEGEYTLTVRNLTDCSMERNVMPEARVKLFLKTGAFPTPEPTPLVLTETVRETIRETVEREKLNLWWVYALIGAAAVIGLIAFISHKVKKEQREGAEKAEKEQERLRERAKRNAEARNTLTVGLQILRDGDRTASLRVDGRAVVGRADECDLQIRDKKVSRQHLLFMVENGILLMEDISSNGTLCNDLPVSGRVVVHPGDTITLGDTLLRIQTVQNAEGVR